MDALVKGISVFQSLITKQTEVLGAGVEGKMDSLLDEEFGKRESSPSPFARNIYRPTYSAPQSVSYANERKSQHFQAYSQQQFCQKSSWN